MGEVGAPQEPILDVRNLWRIFGGDQAAATALAKAGAARQEIVDKTGSLIAVRDVSFNIKRGESFIVMGLSGSGKSTLLRCLVRLIEPTAGEVHLNGTSLLDMGPDELREVRRGHMAMVFQHFGLLPHRSVLDNVGYGLEVQGVDKTARMSSALDALESVGLADWADHFPNQLSGGMQQRVGLARALAIEPEIVFFDEPFSALDPLIRRDMQDELLELQRNDRRTVVFITHDFDEALKLGDRIAIMKDGMFDQVGTPVELCTSPATDYVREFTRDVSKAKVVTVGSCLAADSAGTAAGETMPAEMTLEAALPRLIASNDPIRVVDKQGRSLGIIDTDAAIALLKNDAP